MKILLTILLCSFASLSFSQDHSYSFSGTVTPEKEIGLINKIGSLEGVDYCKMRYKSDSQRGEIILVLERKETRTENEHAFSPTSVKAILQEYQLEPLEFRTIK